MKTAVSLEVLSHVILMARLPDHLPWSDCRVCKFPLIFLSLYLAAVFIGMEFFGSNRRRLFRGVESRLIFAAYHRSGSSAIIWRGGGGVTVRDTG